MNDSRITSGPIGLLWKLTLNENSSGYLLGSIHQTPSYLNNFNEKIISGLNKAKVIAFEIVGKNEVKEAFLKKQMECQIEELMVLTVTQKQQLRSLFEKLNSMFFDVKSKGEHLNEKLEDILYILNSIIFLSPKFEEEIAQKLCIQSGHENVIAKWAYEKGIPSTDLETLDKHLMGAKEKVFLDRHFFAILSSAESPEQMLELIQKRIENHIETQKKYFSIWEKGDTEQLEEMEKAWNDKAMKMRNYVMADKIDQLIREKQSPFCVVGFSHAMGILAKLKEYGYTVEQIR